MSRHTDRPGNPGNDRRKAPLTQSVASTESVESTESVASTEPVASTDRAQRRDRRHQLGADGESHAASHLRRRGYRIVARNVRAGGVELDVVARRGTLAVFVEVKTRRAGGFGAGEEAVDAAKRARLIRGASAWLHEKGRGIRHARFDVIVCEWDTAGRAWRVRHIEDAFDANG